MFIPREKTAEKYHVSGLSGKPTLGQDPPDFGHSFPIMGLGGWSLARTVCTPRSCRTPAFKCPPVAPGGDATWQTNFLGPFLLTELLNRFRKEQHRDPVRREREKWGINPYSMNTPSY